MHKMKLQRPPRQTRLPGQYIGQYPEDIYVRRGDSWFIGNVEHLVTTKKYIINANNEYDIEVEAEPVQNTAQGIESLNNGRKEESFDLPDPLNPTADTYQYHLSISVGDDYVDKNGRAWKVTGKYFREMSGGRLKIAFYYA
jgi:hypothetical protein